MARRSEKLSDETIVTFVGSLGDGTHIVKHADGRLERQRGKTNWAALDALTDDDIAKAVADDPDAAPIDIDWSKATLIQSNKKKAISIRVDEDVLDFFKRDGDGYQGRMNAVLRSYMQQKSKTGKHA